MSSASTLAAGKLEEVLASAERTMRAVPGAEQERLAALREVNPSIRQDELDHLAYRIEESAPHIRHAILQVQALCLIITT